MGTDLKVIDRELTARKTIFAQLLPPSVSPDRLMRTVMMSCERNPALLNCHPQSIINAATTAAVLGLECDGVTGQGYIVPFKGQATFVIGYKGFNTLAARAGYTITGGIVREGDEFDYQRGTGAYVMHRPRLGNQGRIVCAWAVAESRSRPAIVEIVAIEEIEEIRAKSPGARKTDGPWNTHYAAMAEKTAKRRLARSMPMSVMQTASALDAASERELPAFADVQGQVHVDAGAAGPAAQGVIVDVQPEDLTTRANAWPPPEFRTLKQFVDWSMEYLSNATTEDAGRWENQFRSKLLTMIAGGVEMERAANELMELFHERIQQESP